MKCFFYIVEVSIRPSCQNPGQFIRALEERLTSTGPTACDKPRTICISAATFFPKTSSTIAPNSAFHIESLLARTTATAGTAIPNVYGDFLVRVEPPIKSPYTRPVSGMSLNVGAQMCTITLVVIGTGYVINHNITKVTDHQRIMAERTYRVQLQVAMQGDPC